MIARTSTAACSRAPAQRGATYSPSRVEDADAEQDRRHHEVLGTAAPTARCGRPAWPSVPAPRAVASRSRSRTSRGRGRARWRCCRSAPKHGKTRADDERRHDELETSRCRRRIGAATTAAPPISSQPDQEQQEQHAELGERLDTGAVLDGPDSAARKNPARAARSRRALPQSRPRESPAPPRCARDGTAERQARRPRERPARPSTRPRAPTPFSYYVRLRLTARIQWDPIT